MTDQRDPLLESAFLAAEEEAASEAFTTQVMSGVDAWERWAWVGQAGIGLALLACAALFAPALQEVAGALNQALLRPLVDDAPSAFSPMNNLAALAAAAGLGLLAAARSLYAWLTA